MRTLLSGVMLMLMVPVLVLQCLRALYRQEKIHIYSCDYAGRGLVRIQHRTLMINNRPLADLDSWLHYFKGDLDIVGPGRIEFKSAISFNSIDSRRFNVAPGLISPYRVKQISGIAYKSERDICVEFADDASILRRFQLIVAWVIKRSIGANRGALGSPKTFTLFGVEINNVTMSDAVNTIMRSLAGVSPSSAVAKFAFVNADCANHLYSDYSYKENLKDFDQVYPDGVGVKVAARMQGLALKQNVNGTDMFPLLCERLEREGKSVYLHGASEGVISRLVDNLRTSYPELKIAGYSDGYTYSQNKVGLRAKINRSDADLLLVALGAPRQELWIADNSPFLAVKTVIGVGGLFDFYSGEVSRAPVWMRELSLEWVWRLVQQPKDKARRYLIGSPLFLMRLAYSLLAVNTFNLVERRRS